jgi:hypothetical protein
MALVFVCRNIKRRQEESLITRLVVLFQKFEGMMTAMLMRQ